MAAQRRFGHERARLVNGLPDAVGCVFAVLRYVTPDVENVRPLQEGESIDAHRLGARSSRQVSFIV